MTGLHRKLFGAFNVKRIESAQYATYDGAKRKELLIANYQLKALRKDEFLKANYVGNKRRLANYIVGKFPEGAKTLYDPMAGCSAVLIEAAKRGYKVKGNDLSIPTSPCSMDGAKPRRPTDTSTTTAEAVFP